MYISVGIQIAEVLVSLMFSISQAHKLEALLLV